MDHIGTYVCIISLCVLTYCLFWPFLTTPLELVLLCCFEQATWEIQAQLSKMVKLPKLLIHGKDEFQ